MSGQFWLMKSEPAKYSFAQLLKDGRTTWDGVRNFEARNNMRGMKKGDLAFFYHSNEGKEIVGVVRVDREAYPDPTAPGEDWSVVEVVPVSYLKTPVSLDVIKSDPSLADIALLKRRILIREGFPRQALLMTVVRDETGAGHAVITVVTDRGDYVLDSKTSQILPWSATGYGFVKRQSQANANVWVKLGEPASPGLIVAGH